MPSFKLKCASWNILADGMSINEFVTNGGDQENVLWSSRRPRINSVLQKFLENQVQVIGLQENDHPYSILQDLQKIKPEIRCIHLLAKGASRSADILRMNGIFEYLSSIDKSFAEQATNSDRNKEQDYLKINHWYKHNSLDQIKNKFTITSFREENAEILAKVLNRNLDDLYVVNDGISLYYDSNVLECVGPLLCRSMSETEFPTLFIGRDLAIRFKILDHEIARKCDKPKFVNIICTHLKSGEGFENEKRRVEQMSELLRLANDQNEPCVVLLDSNTSNLYKEEILKSNPNEINLVDNIIEENGFHNVIPTKGNECFKMRHAQGSQPNKFGNIMFDTIDKILIQKKWCNNFQCCKPEWLKTLPNEHYDEVHSWRVDPEKRNQLKRICRENKWGDDMNKNKLNESTFNRSIFNHLYPNQDMPSDHPPVMADITFEL